MANRNGVQLDGKVVLEPKLVNGSHGNQGVMVRLLNNDGRKLQFVSISVWDGPSPQEKLNFALASSTVKGDIVVVDGHLRFDKNERGIVAVSEHDSYINMSLVVNAMKE